MIANMNAELVSHLKRDLPGGLILEIVIWEVPTPVPGSMHLFKYRLFFGSPGRRIIGYDNERGKGDHRHVDDAEYPYVFRGVAALIADFNAEVQKWRADHAQSDRWN